MMKPKLNSSFVCITDNPILGAKISSLFNEASEYFIVLEAPRMKRPGADSEVKRRANLISIIKPEKVILADLDSDSLKSFREVIPNDLLIIISEDQDIDMKLGDRIATKNGVIECRNDQIMLGLTVAKYQNKFLNFNNDAKYIDEKSLQNISKEHLIIYEKDPVISPIAEVITANYAFSTGASIVTIQAIDIDETKEINYQIQESHGDLIKCEEIRKLIADRVNLKVDLDDYLIATFVTSGIPFAFIYKNVIPICHVLRYPELGRFLCNALLDKNLYSNNGGAIVFSPEYFFPDEETEDVINILEERGYFVEELTGERASYDNFDDYCVYFPYDILHICSHGGIVDGYYVKEKIYDRDRNPHIIEYEEVIGHRRPNEEDLIEVTSNMNFQKFDEYEWKSQELDDSDLDVNIIMSDWLKNKKRNVLSRIPIKSVKFSNQVLCKGSCHYCNFHLIASQGSPVVFNNSCSSWNGIGLRFIHAGAKAYVGTLWKVDNAVAVSVARDFYDYSKTKSLIKSLWHAQKNIGLEKNKNIYVFWGIHLSKLDKVTYDPKKKISEIKNIFINSWSKAANESQFDDVRRNANRGVNFLNNLDLD